MSLEDRDWYRAELRRKRVHRAPSWMDRALLELVVTLTVIIAATPWLMTPRATYGAGWQALIERVEGNMRCSRTEGS
jgi:hypothetical protein